MSGSGSRPLKRTAEEAGFHNHDIVHNQAVNQTNHGPLYFGNVNIYNGVPIPNPHHPTPTDLDSGIFKSLAFPGMLDRRDEIANPHQNTCHWIFDLEEYREWAESSRGLLWIKGKPGSGKSTLMAFLHRRLREQRHAQGAIHLDFFFSARASELQRTPCGMLRSLLNQLLCQCPIVGSAVATSYQEKCNAYGRDQQSWTWQQSELERLLSAAIVAASQCHQVTVFVDALDEAGEEAAGHIARYIHDINDQVAVIDSDQVDVRLKFCLSSRHYPIVSTVRGSEIWVEHHNQGDMAAFIHDGLRLDSLESDDIHHLSDWQQFEEEVLTQAKGVFQWVRVVLPLLSRGLKDGWSPGDVRELLRSQDLGDIYTRILQNVINQQHLVQSLLLFQWVCFAERPLSTTEMMYALASNKPVTQPLQLRTNENLMKKRIHSLSGGLIEVVSRLDKDGYGHGVNDQTHTVQVIHQTVREFLTKHGLELLSYRVRGHGLPLPIQTEYDPVALIKRSHTALYWCCLNYLSSLNLQAIMPVTSKNNLRDASWKEREQLKKDLTASLPFLKYTIMHLFEHARKASVLRCSEISQSESQQRELEMLSQIRQCWSSLFRVLGPYSRIQPCQNWSMLHISSAFDLNDIVQHLVSGKHRIDLQDENGYTPFHLASLHGHLNVCETLFQAGALVNTAEWYGASPLVSAAGGGHATLVAWLLDHGSGIDSSSANGKSALSVAAGNGHFATVRALLDAGADVNAQGGQYVTALQAASFSAFLNIVQMLLDAGADVNAQGGKYSTALHAAAAQPHGNAGIVQILLKAGADVNARGGRCSTALHVASYYSGVGVVQILLAAGAKVNAQGGHYGTALQAAAARRYDSMDVVQILLAAGAKVNAQAGYYGTALQAAAARRNGRMDVVQILLAAGAKVNAQAGYYGTALQAAAVRCYDRTDVVQMLLKVGAKVNARGGYYGTALHAASYYGNTNIVQVLLDAGADVNARGGHYGTALHAAAAQPHGNAGIVQILLKAGADVNAQGGEYGTALHTARLFKRDVIAQILIAAGATE